MIRTLVLSLMMVATSAPAASAQQWARRMFEKCDTQLSHDFGVVAKDADAVHDFVFQNIFEEDIHISGVRSSCGCTEPRITKNTLKTWEKSAVRAVFNTKAFTGSRSATLTLIIDRPYYAEVQLSVRGYIRSDVMFTPGSVAFGDVEFGQTAQRQIKISYVGRSSWDIVDVRSANSHFEVELNDRQNNFGRVTYVMTVRLKSDAPPGYLQDQLTIVTNDSYNRSLELPVEGRIVSPLSVSPASLFLGVLKPGEVVSRKQLFVRGTKPFKITSIDCAGSGFQFTIPETSKTTHLVPFTYTAGNEPGTVTQTIEIKTDLGATTSCVASARITAPQSAASNLELGEVDDNQ